MKRILSVLLVAMLVVTFVPTTFAAEKNTAVHDNTQNYKFTTTAYGSEVSTTTPQEYWNAETTKAVSDQWNLVCRNGTNWMELRNTASGSHLHWNAYQKNADNGTVVVMLVDIDEAGTYIPKLSYNALPEGYIHDVYFVPDDGSITWGADEIYSSGKAVMAYVEDKSPIATIDMWNTTKEARTAVFDSVEVETAGKYLLVFISNGYNEKMVPYHPDHRTFMRAEVCSFDLEKDLNAEAVANGELEYVTSLNGLATSKMLVHGTSGSSTEGLRSATLLHYYPYLDWKYTTTLGGTGSGNKTSTTVEPYHTLDMTKTDPYKLDNILTSKGGLNGFVSTRVTPTTGVNGSAKRSVYNQEKLQNDRPMFVFRVNIPYAGKYTMTTRGYKYHQGVVNDVRFGKATSDERLKGSEAAKIEIVGKYYGNLPVSEETQIIEAALTGEVADTSYGNPIDITVPEAGEYWIVFDTSLNSLTENPYYIVDTKNNVFQNMSISGIKLTPKKADDYITEFSATADKTTLTAGETANVSATATYKEAGAGAVTNLTYKSSKPSVASITSNGIILAKSAGKTLITVTCENGNIDSFFVTVKDKETKKAVSYAKATNLSDDLDVKSDARGTEVTVVADEIQGYTFRHWVRGTEDNGSWLSADKSYTFTLMTNTYLTAIYSENTTGKLVEFFNENGDYFASATAGENDTVALPQENPERTGFEFIRWITAKDVAFTAETVLTNAVTRVVAEFGATDDTYTVTTPDGTATYSYGDAINLVSSHTDKAGKTTDYSSYWYRDGKQVYYGTEYTYYVWDDTTITRSTAGIRIPTVVLDETVKSGNANMIEYDSAEKTIVEVGIIFGNGSQTIESCDSKATSKSTASHGQFTAKPGTGGTVARGYLIYEEGGSYRVIYSD